MLAHFCWSQREFLCHVRLAETHVSNVELDEPANNYTLSPTRLPAPVPLNSRLFFKGDLRDIDHWAGSNDTWFIPN